MTNDEKLELVEALLGYDGSEELLEAYLKIAGSKILQKAFPYDSSVTEVPPQYDLLQCEIAVYLYNKRGAEGQNYHSENGINRSYENSDVPKSMLASVTPRVGVV